MLLDVDFRHFSQQILDFDDIFHCQRICSLFVSFK